VTLPTVLTFIYLQLFNKTVQNSVPLFSSAVITCSGLLGDLLVSCMLSLFVRHLDEQLANV
jgi:hypothetical protein